MVFKKYCISLKIVILSKQTMQTLIKLALSSISSGSSPLAKVPFWGFRQFNRLKYLVLLILNEIMFLDWVNGNYSS